jgi:hypothetical protein
MKKGIFSFIVLFLAISFHSCNEITVAEFVLSDDNTPLHNISYKYWYPSESKKLKKNNILVVENAKKDLKKRLWMVTPFDNNAKKNEVIYLRRKEVSDKRYILQATSWETRKSISLFIGGVINDSTIQFYGFNDEAMAFGSQSSSIAGIQNHVIVEKNNIKFDSIASINHRKEILEFIKELDNSKYYEEEIVTLVGTNDIEKIKSLLKE